MAPAAIPAWPPLPSVCLALAMLSAPRTTVIAVETGGLVTVDIKTGPDIGTVFTDHKNGKRCFLDVVTYDLCCLPQPRDECWDDVYTADRCCHGQAMTKPAPPMVPHDDPFDCFGLGILTYDQCCLPSDMGPTNPACWDEAYTPEKCCMATVNMSAGKGSSQGIRGNPECWFGSLNYESCCLPSPREMCFRHDKYFTAERCCSDNTEILNLSPLDRLKEELLTDVDPYVLLNYVTYDAEEHYPDSHLTAEIVHGILKLLAQAGQDVSLWLEAGSFLGGSAITTASAFKAKNLSIGIVCMDPFTGDVGMWATRKAMRAVANHPLADSALKMDQFGHSRIYETFLANVRAKGYQDVIMPLRITSVIGMRLLLQLFRDARIQVLPQVIYLDSAHEEGETLLEVRTAWNMLPSPGIVFGDDWSWEGVRDDVATFATQMRLPGFTEEELRLLDTTAAWKPASQPHPGIALISEHDGTWVMFKRSGGPA